MGFINMSWLKGCGLFIISHESQDVHDKMENLYIQNIPISLYSPLSSYGYFFKPTTKIAWFKPKNYKKA
jgi:hypothetical protein